MSTDITAHSIQSHYPQEFLQALDSLIRKGGDHDPVTTPPDIVRKMFRHYSALEWGRLRDNFRSARTVIIELCSDKNVYDRSHGVFYNLLEYDRARDTSIVEARTEPRELEALVLEIHARLESLGKRVVWVGHVYSDLMPCKERLTSRLRIASILRKLEGSHGLTVVLPGDYLTRDNIGRSFARVHRGLAGPDVLDVNHYSPYFLAIVRGVLMEKLLAAPDPDAVDTSPVSSIN